MGRTRAYLPPFPFPDQQGNRPAACAGLSFLSSTPRHGNPWICTTVSRGFSGGCFVKDRGIRWPRHSHAVADFFNDNVYWSSCKTVLVLVLAWASIAVADCVRMAFFV